jgi:choline dehydrogenase-like flavoprotein
MQIVDLRTLESGSVFDTDLCIVGSGPAGLTVAAELAGTKIRTIVVESGGLQEDAETDELSRFESVGEPRVMDYRRARNRIFGGTSHTWTGRCAPFDDVDFAERSWVPFSGWPIERSALNPFLERACGYMGLDATPHEDRILQTYHGGGRSTDVDHGLLSHCYWQYSTNPAKPWEFMHFGREFLAKTAEHVRVLLHATVRHLNTNEPGTHLDSVDVITLDGKSAKIRPRILVLCAGGIDNARILLTSNRTVAAGVGNQNDMVGRFLMDHPRCVLGEFDPHRAREVRTRYGLAVVGQPSSRHFFARGLMLSPEIQRQDQLLNCAAWLTEHRTRDDPWDALKRLVSGNGRRIFRDSWWVLSQPHFIARGLYDRVIRAQGLPHKLERLTLDCIVEQQPNPHSRILLSNETDRLGLPLARLDWRISEQERLTAVKLANLIHDEFERTGLLAPRLADWAQGRQGEQVSFVDVFHPTGTTRMSSDPKRGVVDENCQVHGVDNVYIAGSSVFPTTGHANPTLMIVALSIRLANWLRDTM